MLDLNLISNGRKFEKEKDLEVFKKMNSIEQSQAAYDKHGQVGLKEKFEKQIKDLNEQQEILVKKWQY